MQVECLDFIAGAEGARGIAIVIDVFRAFSLAPYAAARGARLLPVAEPDWALELRDRHPHWLLCGERHGKRLPGFDYGNSPHDISRADVAGRTLVHTTHAGTQGLVRADGADEVLTGSFVNAAALVRYVHARHAGHVSIVRMGHQALETCVEDDACAELLRARLTGTPCDEVALLARLPGSPAAAKFLDPGATWAPFEDLALCMALDRFDFVLRLGSPDAEGLRFLERLET